jgi:hypothetical protein
MNNDQAVRDRIWQELYNKIVAFVGQYGRQQATTGGDFWVLADDYGWPRHTVFFYDLKMLDATIVTGLRALLRDLPNWEIVIALDIPGKENEWPPMGITIRRNEIVDGLVRALLPAPYNALIIPDSRPGTGYD